MLATHANTNGVWPNSLVRRPPWLLASSVKNKQKLCHTLPYFAILCHTLLYIAILCYILLYFAIISTPYQFYLNSSKILISDSPLPPIYRLLGSCYQKDSSTVMNYTQKCFNHGSRCWLTLCIFVFTVPRFMEFTFICL
jgi:hypothetical protein